MQKRLSWADNQVGLQRPIVQSYSKVIGAPMIGNALALVVGVAMMVVAVPVLAGIWSSPTRSGGGGGSGSGKKYL